SQDRFSFARGSYLYMSLADVGANRPAAFARTLAAPAVSSDEVNAALSVGDVWRATDRVQLQYGARAEGDAFLRAPARNPAMEQALGVRTGLAPREAHVSPRVGVTWGIGQRGTAGLRGAPLVFVRGGVGEFRNALPAALLLPALRNTGLPGATRQIQCVGPAVPTPDWSAFEHDPSAIPTQCADRSLGPFATTAPNAV